MKPEDRAHVNFDHPDALDVNLLTQLKAGKMIDVPCYDFTTHSRQHETQVLSPREIVLVEGVLLLALNATRPLLDLKIFVDTPADIRFIRRLVRDIEERGRTVDSGIQQYCATTHPMHFTWVEPSKALADVVVSGENEIETLTALLLDHIASISLN